MRDAGSAILIGASVTLISRASTLGWLGLAIGATVICAYAAAKQRIGTILVLAFAVRALLGILHYYVAPLPDSANDARAFEYRAWELVQRQPDDFWAGLDSGWRLYVWLLSALYRITDRSPLMLQSVNIFFGALVVLNIYLIARAVWSPTVARRAALFAAVFPTFMLYSATTTREVAVIYTGTLGIWCFVRWRQSMAFRWLVPMLAAFFLSTTFHTAGLAFILVVGLLLVMDAVNLGSPTWWLRGSRGVVGVGILAGLLVLIVVSGWGLDKISSLVVSGFSTELIMDLQQGRAKDRAAYLATLTVTHPADLLWQTPLRMVYFLYTPFPWMVRQVGDVIAFIDAMLYLWMSWRIVRFRREIFRASERRGILLLSCALTAVLALGTANYGTALRHRAKVAPMLIVLAVGAGASQGLRRRPAGVGALAGQPRSADSEATAG